MIIEKFNYYYLAGIGAMLLLTLILGLILKGKDNSVQKKILLVVAFLGFAAHFSKLLLPEYKELWPLSIKYVTFDSIRSVGVILFPFILLGNNKFAKDYMFYMGIICSLAAIAYPLDVFGKELTDVNVIMYYVINTITFMVPLYMVLCGLHSIDLKRILFLPVSFLLVLSLILVNEIILMEMGFVNVRNGMFLYPNYRDDSFVFGPRSELAEFTQKFIDPLVPKPFKTIMVGTYKDAIKYTPVLWLLVPSFIYLTVAAGAIYFIFVKVFKKGDGGSYSSRDVF